MFVVRFHKIDKHFWSQFSVNLTKKVSSTQFLRRLISSWHVILYLSPFPFLPIPQHIWPILFILTAAHPPMQIRVNQHFLDQRRSHIRCKSSHTDQLIIHNDNTVVEKIHSWERLKVSLLFVSLEHGQQFDDEVGKGWWIHWADEFGLWELLTVIPLQVYQNRTCGSKNQYSVEEFSIHFALSLVYFLFNVSTNRLRVDHTYFLKLTVVWTRWALPVLWRFCYSNIFVL